MSNKVRAKFECLEKHVEAGGITVVFQPVVAGSPEENKHFWEATPSGRLEMWITNQQAADFFEVGEAYYLDFAKAD